MLFQAFIIALITWIVATFMPMCFRWSLYFGAPLVAGLVDGIILGDIPYGLQVGATIQMAYIGLVAAGGALPSDLALAGYLGVAMTMLAKAPPSVGLTLAVPIGFLGLLSFNARMTLNALWVHRAEKYAENADTKGIIWMNLGASQIVPFLTYFIPTFLAIYYGAGSLENFMKIVPQSLITALKVTGGLIPAVGLGMLLKFLWRSALVPFLFIGFILASYLKLDIVGVAVLGGALGFLHLMYSKDKAGGVSDGFGQ
ncbi:MAG TPA: PTS sugar transporter subunit IIC [Thermoanaerobacterales bacterium]|nr:D-glucosaminate system component [Thermoanaerobacteraceae bacterium]HHW02547.1 PTS sugar transporter subunit IIC [Thermoanaerobacterales bacterium]